ncbi:MAG: Efem/EfeO family lipoprotein [Candidatus Roseilinea sp.]|nr:MAG: Efem/EfeO family lipoprotein [Candidatus Roseilinea sp.]
MFQFRRYFPPFLAATMALTLTIAGCTAPPVVAPTVPPSAPNKSADLSGIKSYLLEKTGQLRQATRALKETSDRYYALAKEANFDYTVLFATQKDEVIGLIQTAREQWMVASPLYEQMEGIVAGTPSLAEFDVIMDAGASKEEDPQDPAPIDVTLPDGRVLEKPGNLFGVTESTLWGTFEAFRSPGQFDFNGDGQIAFGESLPDANVLKGGVDALDEQAGKLAEAARAWTPTESDAFTALVVMVPTMSEYFDSWKNSRFVSGEASTQRDFVAISRLADIQDILSSLLVVHENISPMIRSVDAAQDDAVRRGLSDLKAFVADVHKQEIGGKRFKPEEADVLGKEAQDRADAITGQIAQMAARLGVKIEQ